LAYVFLARGFFAVGVFEVVGFCDVHS